MPGKRWLSQAGECCTFPARHPSTGPNALILPWKAVLPHCQSRYFKRHSPHPPAAPMEGTQTRPIRVLNPLVSSDGSGTDPSPLQSTVILGLSWICWERYVWSQHRGKTSPDKDRCIRKKSNPKPTCTWSSSQGTFHLHGPIHFQFCKPIWDGILFFFQAKESWLAQWTWKLPLWA